MNARGSITLWGLVMCGMIGLATIVAGSSYEMFARTAREAQVRSRMTALESQIRSMAFQPYSYTCGADVGLDAVSAISTCALVNDFYKDVSKVDVPGARCDGGGACGFRLDELGFTTSGSEGRFHAKLVYDGTEARLRPSIIDLTIPVELLQSSTFDCTQTTPADRPAFVGFDAAGKPMCRGFTPANIVTGATGAEGGYCPQGTYLSYVEWNTLKFYCRPIDGPNRVINCPPGQAVADMSWTGGVLKAHCRDLPEAPFSP